MSLFFRRLAKPRGLLQPLCGGKSASSDEAALLEAASSRSSAPTVLLMLDSIYDESDDMQSDIDSLKDLMSVYDNPDTWSERLSDVINSTHYIDFSRITHPVIEDAVRSTMSDLAGQANAVQNGLRKIQNSYLGSREEFVMLVFDATLILGYTERDTKISEVLILSQSMYPAESSKR